VAKVKFETFLKSCSRAISSECDPLVRRGNFPRMIDCINSF
jgi:hypothetical protein